MNNLNGFRGLLLSIWLASWILMCAIVLAAETIRHDQAIELNDRIEALMMLSPIWLTPLACFGAFWFPEDERHAARVAKLPPGRAAAALALTLPFLLLILVLTWSVVTTKFSVPSIVDLPSGDSFLERIGRVVKFAGLLSPLALTPTLWMTRRGKATRR